MPSAPETVDGIVIVIHVNQPNKADVLPDIIFELTAGDDVAEAAINRQREQHAGMITRHTAARLLADEQIETVSLSRMQLMGANGIDDIEQVVKRRGNQQKLIVVPVLNSTRLYDCVTIA